MVHARHPVALSVPRYVYDLTVPAAAGEGKTGQRGPAFGVAWGNAESSGPEKGVRRMEWIAPDFEEVETSAEVTAYVGHW